MIQSIDLEQTIAAWQPVSSTVIVPHSREHLDGLALEVQGAKWEAEAMAYLQATHQANYEQTAAHPHALALTARSRHHHYADHTQLHKFRMHQ